MAIHSPLSLLYNLPEGIFTPLASMNRRNDPLVGRQNYGQGQTKVNHQSHKTMQ